MNRVSGILIILLFSHCALWAQDNRKSIVDDLNTQKVNQGNVRIFQEESLKNVIGARFNDSITADTEFVKIKGYKITLFSGNNQNKSKQEAESKRGQFRQLYPDVEASITYNSPQWRLRVGNYRTREEAQEAMADMRKNLPSSLSREMRISEDIIKVPVF